MTQDEYEQTIRNWLQEHDESAARNLVAALYPLVASIIRKRLPLHEREEDLSQEVFMKMFAGLHQYDSRLPLENWVSRIAVNACVDHFRSQQRRPILRLGDLTDTEAEMLEKLARDERGIDPSTAASARELYEKLLGCLAPEDRLVVTLLQIEGRSVAEIRDITGWNLAMIKVRAFRARNKMKKQLALLEKERP